MRLGIPAGHIHTPDMQHFETDFGVGDATFDAWRNPDGPDQRGKSQSAHSSRGTKTRHVCVVPDDPQQKEQAT